MKLMDIKKYIEPKSNNIKASCKSTHNIHVTTSGRSIKEDVGMVYTQARKKKSLQRHATTGEVVLEL